MKLMQLFIALAVMRSLVAPAHSAQVDSDALRRIGAEVKEKDGVVTELKADCSQFGKSEYQLINKITTLKSLSLSGKALSDEDLATLGSLGDLESVLLNGTQLTDEGYRHFAAFKKLKRLSLFHPSRDCKDFTGAGLAHLKALPQLERLTFAGATAGDEAFEAVGQLTQLKQFSEWHNWESPAAIRHLLKLPNLTYLKIGQRLPGRDRPLTPSFDDNTLATIAQMKSLEHLELQEASLSFDGLSQLKVLANLKELKVKWVDTPGDDVERLGKVLPKVKITWEPLSATDREALLFRKLKLQ